MTTSVKKAPHHHDNWQGYTIDELRYQRALTSARLEIQKEKLSNQFQTIRGTFGMVEGKGIMGKMLSSLNYVDYAVLAFQTVRRLSALFRHRKN